MAKTYTNILLIDDEESLVKVFTKYLQKKGRNVLNISQILYEVGFNSKAAFYRAFSRHVGMSPKEFKKQSQAQKLGIT